MGVPVILGIDIDGVLAQYQGAVGNNEVEWWKPEVFRQCEVMPGAKDACDALVALGHKIKIITARSPHFATPDWLNEHQIPWSSIHHTRAKWDVPCHIYLDDGPPFLNGFHERGLTAVRWAYPHNAGCPSKWTVQSWGEFLELITSGVKGKLRRRPRRMFRAS